MLWTRFSIILVVWAIGMVTSTTVGGVTHLLRLIAIVVVLARIIQGWWSVHIEFTSGLGQLNCGCREFVERTSSPCFGDPSDGLEVRPTLTFGRHRPLIVVAEVSETFGLVVCDFETLC